jgi:hypothetical protein
MGLISVDYTKVAALQAEQAVADRKAAYIAEADPLFFKAQRGEVTLQEWQDKIAEIKLRYPKALPSGSQVGQNTPI